MLSRQITIGGNPNIQHVLYFDSASDANKGPEEIADRLVFKDNYGQTLSLHKEAVVISDLIQVGAEAIRAQIEMKVVEIKGQSKMQKRLEDDAELRIIREQNERRQKEAPAPANA